MTEMAGQDILAEVLQRNSSLFQSPRETQETKDLPEGIQTCVEASTVQVFKTMCGIDLTRNERIDGRCDAFNFDASGIVTITGATQATVAVRFPKQLALACTNALLGKTSDRIDEEVVDVIGEIANMVVGGAKERFAAPNLTLGLPLVVTGSGHRVLMPPQVNILSSLFSSASGDCIVEIGIKPSADSRE
ncbi:chemotaxis protein CheX [Rhodopirellula europaea]